MHFFSSRWVRQTITIMHLWVHETISIMHLWVRETISICTLVPETVAIMHLWVRETITIMHLWVHETISIMPWDHFHHAFMSSWDHFHLHIGPWDRCIFPRGEAVNSLPTIMHFFHEMGSYAWGSKNYGF